MHRAAARVTGAARALSAALVAATAGRGVTEVLLINVIAVRERAGVPQHVSSADLITSNIMMLM